MNNNLDTQIHSAPSPQGRAGVGSICHLVILGDGMAYWHVPSLGGKTLLQIAAEIPEAEETAALLRDLVVRSQALLLQHAHFVPDGSPRSIMCGWLLGQIR